MNPKITKVIGEIEKAKEKLAECQSRIKELERQKTEYENADIIAMVRGIDIPPAEFEAFARAFMEQRKSAAVPDGFAPSSGRGSRHARNNDESTLSEQSENKEVKELEE